MCSLHVLLKIRIPDVLSRCGTHRASADSWLCIPPYDTAVSTGGEGWGSTLQSSDGKSSLTVPLSHCAFLPLPNVALGGTSGAPTPPAISSSFRVRSYSRQENSTVRHCYWIVQSIQESLIAQKHLFEAKPWNVILSTTWGSGHPCQYVDANSLNCFKNESKDLANLWLRSSSEDH